MIEDGLLLYLNPVCAQGFDYCHIYDSSDEFSLMPIQKEQKFLFNLVSPQGKYMLNQQKKLYCWALIKLTQDQRKPIQRDQQQDEELKELIKNLDDFGQNLRCLFTISDNNQLIQNKQNAGQTVSEIIERDLINKPIFQFIKSEDPSITFCLLYNGESQKELNSKLQFYQSQCSQYIRNQIVFVILVNGKKSLHESLQNFNDNQKIPDQIRHNSCQAYQYFDNENIHNNVLFLLITEKQSQIKLLRWIYSGVFKHFYSKYCYVGDLDYEIKQEYLNQAFHIILDHLKPNEIQSNKNNYFGVSGYCDLIRKQNQNDQNRNDLFEEIIMDQFIRYNNYLNYQLQIDSLANVKKYHNPFFGFYKLNSIYNVIDEYLKKLEKDYEKGKIDLKLNLILPKMMYKQSKEILYVPASAIGNKYIKKEDETYYKQFDDLQIKQKSLIECNKKATQTDSLFYKLIYRQREIEFKLKLAVVLFIYIFSPYQLFWQITGNYVLRISVTIFLPFLMLLSLFLYIILPQQYQITDVIIKCKKKLINLFQRESKLFVYFNNKLCQGKLIQDIENQSNEIKITYKNKTYSIFKLTIQDQQTVIQQTDQLENHIYQSQCNIIREVKVAVYYKTLFLITCIISFLSSIIVISNIIYTYSYYLINFDQSYVKFQIMFLLLAIFCFLFLRTKCNLLLFGMIFFMLTIVMYSEIYHMLHYSKKFKQYYHAFNRLGEYLAITIFFLFIFLLIENLTEYQGYAFLGIIYYNLIIIFLDLILIILANLVQNNNQIPKQDSKDQPSFQIEYEKVYEEQEQQYEQSRLEISFDQQKSQSRRLKYQRLDQ